MMEKKNWKGTRKQTVSTGYLSRLWKRRELNGALAGGKQRLSNSRIFTDSKNLYWASITFRLSSGSQGYRIRRRLWEEEISKTSVWKWQAGGQGQAGMRWGGEPQYGWSTLGQQVEQPEDQHGGHRGLNTQEFALSVNDMGSPGGFWTEKS